MHPRSVGGYDKEEKAARAYDLAALKYWGTTTTTNFPVSSKKKEEKNSQTFYLFLFLWSKICSMSAFVFTCSHALVYSFGIRIWRKCFTESIFYT